MSRVLLLGVPRSGTTWVGRALGATDGTADGDLHRVDPRYLSGRQVDPPLGLDCAVGRLSRGPVIDLLPNQRRQNKEKVRRRKRVRGRDASSINVFVCVVLLLLLLMGLVMAAVRPQLDPLAHSHSHPHSHFFFHCWFILGVEAVTLHEKLRSDGHFTCVGTCAPG